MPVALWQALLYIIYYENHSRLRIYIRRGVRNEERMTTGGALQHVIAG